MYLDRYKDDSTDAGWLLFAMLMFVVMVVSFTIAYAALHLWAISTLLLRLSERQWLRAMGWMLVLALLVRATASARSKYASAFATSNSGDLSAISPAIRLTSASCHFSLVVSTAVIALPMQRQASSKWRRSALALARDDR